MIAAILNIFTVESKIPIITKEKWAFSNECIVCTRKFNNLKGDFQHHWFHKKIFLF